MYELDQMLSIFVSHSMTCQTNQKELIKNFKENNPGTPLPDNLADDFNLPMALASLCHEIWLIKKHISEMNKD